MGRWPSIRFWYLVAGDPRPLRGVAGLGLAECRGRLHGRLPGTCAYLCSLKRTRYSPTAFLPGSIFLHTTAPPISFSGQCRAVPSFARRHLLLPHHFRQLYSFMQLSMSLLALHSFICCYSAMRLATRILAADKYLAAFVGLAMLFPCTSSAISSVRHLSWSRRCCPRRSTAA